MLPLVASPKHYYPATEYDEILPSGATQSCHLNGSGLDCQIPLSEAAWRLRSEQQAVRCGLFVPSTDRSTPRCGGTLINAGCHGRNWKTVRLRRRSDCKNQPIVCDFVPMLFCEISQVGVCGIAFVCDMCRKDAPARTQHTFDAHPVCVVQ
jgi:hypothetical protein